MAPRTEPESDDFVDDVATLTTAAQNKNSTAPRPSHSETDITETKEKWNAAVPPTVSLPLLVMIDMFAVALVVPLLHQYYRTAGVTSANQRELLSSLFSSSQICGGLIIGALSDAGFLSRRNTLFLSFAGSAASYALIVRGGLPSLVCSRVLVGLVKQTMTVTTALLARHTTAEERAHQIGRLNASSTVAWIVGPSVGALLYKHIHHSAPAIVACCLFVLNSIIAAVFLPREEHNKNNSTSKNNTKSTAASKFTSFTSNLRSCFSSKSLASIVTSLLINYWVTRATSYASMASYYEEMYGIEPHQRGYLSSYQQFLSFLAQSMLVRPLLRFAGGERRAACLAALALSFATFSEIWSSLPIFVGVLCPIMSISVALLALSLRSLLTQVAPKDSIGSVLAALDVLQNAAAVTVPFYRTFLFAAMGTVSVDNGADLRGDPNPYTWLTSSTIHWLIASASLFFLLMRSAESKRSSSQEGKIKKL